MTAPARRTVLYAYDGQTVRALTASSAVAILPGRAELRIDVAGERSVVLSGSRHGARAAVLVHVGCSNIVRATVEGDVDDAAPVPATLAPGPRWFAVDGDVREPIPEPGAVFALGADRAGLTLDPPGFRGQWRHPAWVTLCAGLPSMAFFGAPTPDDEASSFNMRIGIDGSTEVVIEGPYKFVRRPKEVPTT
jgi:hypothetical protein